MNSKRLSKKFLSIQFLHLIDHNGTIFNLVSPLTNFANHLVLTSFSSSFKKTMKIIEKLSQNKRIIVILHATGNKKPFYNMKNKLIKKFKKFYIFLHVSPNHFLIKHRLNELYHLKKLVKKHDIKILTPSKELKKEFLHYGMNAIPIQIGIDLKIKENQKKKIKKYITTVCTSDKKVYTYIKGIDIFYKLIKDLNLEKESLILGNNSKKFKGIKTKKTSKNDFLNYLKKSKVYIQLSRTEAYNLSAIYAKQLKIPIIVSNIEGHKDNIKYNFKARNISEVKNYLKKILSDPENIKIKKSVTQNYKDSIKRENLKKFKDSFDKLINIG
jgi:hypothetical protein